MDKNELLEQLFYLNKSYHYISTEFDDITYKFEDISVGDMAIHILHFITENENTTITEIASSLHKSTGSVFKHVKVLIKKGLVSQTRNENDKRIYNLVTTEKGKRLIEHDSYFDELFKKNIFEKLSLISEEEIKTFNTMLSALSEAMSETAEYVRKNY